MKKILILMLALVMCLGVFASCTPAPEEGGSSSESSTPQNPNESTPPAGESSSDNGIDVEMPLPVNLDRDMTIFVGELHYEEWLDNDDGDIVNTELYNRIPRVEENLGIDLSTNRIAGTGGHRAEVYSEVVKYHETTDPNMKVDLCSTYSMWAGSLALEGRYFNVADTDTIDLSKPYWPKDIIEGSAIDGKVYAVSGDISPSLLWETYCIFFNIKLIERYNVPNPIELVVNHDWTIDKMIEITSGIYEDIDNVVQGPSLGDTFAFSFSDIAHIKAIPFAAGLRVVVPDEDEGFILSDLYTGERADALVTKVRDWLNNNNGVIIGGQNVNVGYGEAFKQDQAIFNLGNFAFTKYYLADTGVQYGVIPSPLYDKDQKEYHSYYGNPSAFWGVPSNVQSLEDSCALLESLAADAYIHISPAIFERALKHKYNPGDLNGQSRMFDIIREGLVFDPCMLFNESISNYKQWNEIANSTTSWTALFNKFTTVKFDKNIESIVNKIRALTY